MADITVPTEKTKRDLTYVIWPAIVVALVALPYVAQYAGYPALTTLATRIVILGIAAASLNLLLGFATYRLLRSGRKIKS